MKATWGTVAATLFAIALAGAFATAQQPTPPVPAASTAAGAPTTSTPQSSPPSHPAAQPTVDVNAPELSSPEETATTFQVKVNLVDLRVVIRDANGHAVSNLRKDDFLLTDNGKPQTISRFTMDSQAGAKTTTPPASSETSVYDATPKLPERYVAYLFDDIHLKFGDLAQARDATARSLKALPPTERVAILTTSGQTQLNFTNDGDQIHDALNRLRPHPISSAGVQDCPDVPYYMADQIINKQNTLALQVATYDALDCYFADDMTHARDAQNLARTTAARVLDLGEHETRVTLATLKDVVRKMTAMPGQRSIILVSPGFYNPDQLQEQAEITDRALRSGIVISALDARGLFTVTADAGATRAPSVSVAGPMLQYQTEEALANADVLSELAYATGGTFIKNTNNQEAGLRQLAAPPEYSYLLAFSPQNLKLDGRFHTLKVTVKGQKLQIQTRKGYYAPKQAADAAEQAKQQIQDEVFSQEEVHELPVEFHTQFFKTSEYDAKLSVLIRLDVRHLRYRKEQGRNNNTLTMVAALFDRNGNYVVGNQKTLQMHWKDETLGSKLASGVTLKSSFDVKPGGYLVRLVVRDDNGQLTAQNGAVEIP